MSENSGSYGNVLTIKEVMGKIANTDYLLPSIQRPFVWKHGQIEELFDSLMRGYPIGTFMFWELSKESQNNGLIKLYQFINKVEEDSNQDNTEFNSKLSNKDVYAVIDGQQRLTALNIGLSGYFKYRKKGSWRTGNYPKRELFLDISGTIPDESNDPKRYNFKFLTEEESHSDNHMWFKVGKILDYNDDKLDEYLDEMDYNKETRSILRKLYKTVCDYKVISYYLVKEQKPDEVLDIFIRANSGGTPLSKSDLLMAMATHLWKRIDIREEMSELIEEVSHYGVADHEFWIDRDFVLKTCLVLHSNDVKTVLANFHPENITKFEDNWEKTKKCILSAFQYLHNLGFNDRTIQAKGAVISLIFYIYFNDLQDEINKGNFDPTGENKRNITTWLIRVFINGLYGGAPDAVHLKMRKIIRENPGRMFPYAAILDAYKDEGNSLYVSEDVLRSRLYSRYGSDKAGYMLILLHQHSSLTSVHEDHLHPASVFRNRAYRNVVPEEDWELVDSTWNTVLNLQLLESTLNESKGDKSLTEWMRNNKISPESIYINADTSTELKDYRSFIAARETNLLSKLKKIMDIS